MILLPLLFVMTRSQLTESKASLSAFTQARVMLYRGHRLTEQAIKILERIVDGLIKHVLSIDDSQFSFVSGRVTTDANFAALQLLGKYQAMNKLLYMAFVDLEKGPCPS